MPEQQDTSECYSFSSGPRTARHSNISFGFSVDSQLIKSDSYSVWSLGQFQNATILTLASLIPFWRFYAKQARTLSGKEPVIIPVLFVDSL